MRQVLNYDQLKILEEIDNKVVLRSYDVPLIEDVSKSKLKKNISDLELRELIERDEFGISLSDAGKETVKELDGTLKSYREKKKDRYFAFYIAWSNNGTDTQEIERVLRDNYLKDYCKVYSTGADGKRMGGIVATHCSGSDKDIRDAFWKLQEIGREHKGYLLMNDGKLSSFYKKITGRALRKNGLTEGDYRAIESVLRLSSGFSLKQMKQVGTV